MQDNAFGVNQSLVLKEWALNELFLSWTENPELLGFILQNNLQVDGVTGANTVLGFLYKGTEIKTENSLIKLICVTHLVLHRTPVTLFQKPFSRTKQS